MQGETQLEELRCVSPVRVVPSAALGSRWQLACKRAIDIVVAIVGLLLTLPVLVMAAIAIKLHDGGPVIFTQTRVGRDGEPIRVHKLRTMVVDAEQRLGEVLHLNERAGPLFKIETDPRVTRVGAILRATSIDELPQLWDVLLGTMSLVGPRPALPHEVVLFDDALRTRVHVHPGVTGLWQVEARDDGSFDAYRRLDLHYVEHWSVWLDVRIIAATIPAVLGRSFRAVAARRRELGPAHTPAPTLTVVPAVAAVEPLAAIPMTNLDTIALDDEAAVDERAAL